MKRVAVVVIVVALVSLSFSGCLTTQISGFTEEDLIVPVPPLEDDQPPTLPSPLTSVEPGYSFSLDWTMTEVFAYYGGAMNLSIRNTGDRDLFVYGYGLKWFNSTISHNRSTEVYVHPDARMPLGLLCFGGPLTAEPTMYWITLKIVVRAASGIGWHDCGEVTAASKVIDVRDLVPQRDYTIQENVKDYYNRVNARVNFTAVEDITATILYYHPGDYSTLQIAAAFDWVRSEVAYEADDGSDYWQSAEETLLRRAGDCEDQAILMASIIGALGGNARVNIINEHAFPSVFVARDFSGLSPVWQSLCSYYGTDIALCYLDDYFGYWLVVDTVGFPHAGGLPATSSPSSSVNLTDWTFDNSNWLVTVDATGNVAAGGWLF
ncbi:MAG: transglutaminase-like domain-containing protein [Methanomassiliicoccales archaeon]|nr:transglutaminase-like domain-containing protein [Methanomassiliicoccales archaeon]